MKLKTEKKLIQGLVHLLFWCFSMLSFAFIFQLTKELSILDLIYSFFFHFSIVLGVYLNFYALSYLFQRGKYFKYLLIVALIVALTIVLNQFTFLVLVDLILTDYYFVSQFDDLEVGVMVVIFLFITSVLKLSKSWFELQKMNKMISEQQKEKTDVELKSLKAQINPHFLFNSLNVIYSLSMKNDAAAPEVILKLSDLLRYVIYDSTQEFVDLNSEVQLLEKYIDLQRYRVEESTPISFQYEVHGEVWISPLILLTLVENSFKHGIKGDTEGVFIRIELHSNSKRIAFEIENNLSEDSRGEIQEGIGLENIRKRLKLLYPNRHKLVIQNENSFKVNLEIEHEN